MLRISGCSGTAQWLSGITRRDESDELAIEVLSKRWGTLQYKKESRKFSVAAFRKTLIQKNYLSNVTLPL